jgi:3-methyladenine DNA glycosylase/8-oxoguanine DNA glycosylase
MDVIARVVDYLKSIGLEIEAQEPYTHVGAVIVDSALQAGVNYQYVVKPRVVAVAAIEAARATSGFVQILAKQSPEELLSWRSSRKTDLIRMLTQLLVAEGVETTTDLAGWLNHPDTGTKLMKLRGVGPKTVDYMKSLVGCPSVAIDVHLKRFLERAGVPQATYQDARTVLEHAADRMGVSRSALDYSIWKYMSTQKSPNRALHPTGTAPPPPRARTPRLGAAAERQVVRQG